MTTLKNTGPSGEWLSQNTATWIKRWERRYGVKAFNPFDSLAIGWITHPDLLEAELVSVKIQELPNDMLIEKPDASPKTKPYLLVFPGDSSGRQATYCHTPDSRFKEMLLTRLKGKLNN